MSDEIKEFLDYWDARGVTLPNPDHQPECFRYYIKLWRWATKKN